MRVSDLASSAASRAGAPAVPSTPFRGGVGHIERASKQVRVEETSCWICGEPAKPGDPLTEDHIVPRIHGGQERAGEHASRSPIVQLETRGKGGTSASKIFAPPA